MTKAFHDLRRKTLAYAHAFEQILSDRRPSRTIGLLCPSSEDFLFAWLGLMRCGYSVLLIAYVEVKDLSWKHANSMLDTPDLNVSLLL